MNRTIKFCAVLQVLIVSCNPMTESASATEAWVVETNLLLYFQDNHIALAGDLKDKILFVVPVNSCISCVNETFEIIENFSDKQNLIVLLLYEYEKELFVIREHLDILKNSKVKIINKYPSTTRDYHITDGSPRIYILVKEEIDYVADISKENRGSIIEYITSLYSSSFKKY